MTTKARKRNNEAALRYYRRNKEARRAAHRKYYAANKEKERERSRRYYAENKERERARTREKNRKRLPAPTRPEPSQCECCARPLKSAAHLDHDHATGKFRGWLCGPCNRGIGLFVDSPELLGRAAAYLRAAQ